MAVAAHARVRRQPAGVVGQERIDDPGAELGPQVEREVRQPHLVRDAAGDPHRVGRAARSLAVVLRVRPQLERHRRGVLLHEQRRHRRVDPAAHRHQRRAPDPAPARRRRGRRRQRAVERVGGQVGGVELARRRRRARRRSRAGRRARRRARTRLDQRDGRRAGRRHRPAAGGVEAAAVTRSPSTRTRDADQVAAAAPPAAPSWAPGGRTPSPAGCSRCSRKESTSAESRRGSDRPDQRGRSRRRTEGIRAYLGFGFTVDFSAAYRG